MIKFTPINWRIACRVLTCLKNIYIIRVGFPTKSIAVVLLVSGDLINLKDGARFFNVGSQSVPTSKGMRHEFSNFFQRPEVQHRHGSQRILFADYYEESVHYPIFRPASGGGR
jgi:hypothetical protein